jgi:type VI secretion system secreted protein VgrG
MSQAFTVFWQVGSSATLGTSTAFEGNILALTSITLTTGVNIGCGRALARNGAVTMDTNVVSIDTGGCETSSVSPVPEPSTSSLLLLIGAPGLLWLRKLKSVRE